MFENIHEQFPMFSELIIFIKLLFSSTLKNNPLFSENPLFTEDKDIKKFTTGTNIEILILYFIQKNELQQTELKKYNILQIFKLLEVFFDNIHNERFIKLSNPYNYLGEEIKPEDTPRREKEIKELTTILNQTDVEQEARREELKFNIDKLNVDNIILEHYDYKIKTFIDEDKSRIERDPNIPPTIRIIHPISHTPIWFGNLTEQSPLKDFIDFNVQKIKTNSFEDDIINFLKLNNIHI